MTHLQPGSELDSRARRRSTCPASRAAAVSRCGVGPLLAALAALAGCENGFPEPTTVAITQYIIRTGPGTYELTSLAAEGVADEIPLAEDKSLTTEQYILGHIEGEGPLGAYNFDILYGPDWGVPGEAGMISFDKRDGFYLGSGWALLKGHCPLGQTARTQAAARGTTLLLRVNNTGPSVLDEVYLIAAGTSSGTYAKPIDSTEIRAFEGARQFQYLTNASRTGPIEPPAGTSVPVAASPSDEWNFLMRVKEVADVAGMWPP